MSYRQKLNGSWVVEIYDPIHHKKVHVRPSDHGMGPLRNERQAKALERKALEQRDRRRPGAKDETVGSFQARWMDDYSAGRGESTQAHYIERTAAFAKKYKDRTLRSITREEARRWAKGSPGTVAQIRTMFGDALDDQLVDSNQFARLGLAQTKGREDITVLTVDEVDVLAGCAREAHPGWFGEEMAALIVWLAYTCMRPGEAYAARHSLLDGDVYTVQAQFNSHLGRETRPKHDGTGAIYVPGPAQSAIRQKSRRLDDDLMFHGKRGQRLRQESMHRYWAPIRSGFMAKLPRTHHLHERVALDPKDQFDPYELRHMGASYMLNDLGIEPWVIARQLRHSDDGALVISLYGHPTRRTAIEKMRRAFTAPRPTEISEARSRRANEA